MLETHLKTIRSKEIEAKAGVKKAEARAESILEEAHGKGEDHLEGVRADAAELERSLVSGARREAEEKIAVMRAENAKRIAALSVGAKKNIQKAVSAVLKAFREGR